MTNHAHEVGGPANKILFALSRAIELLGDEGPPSPLYTGTLGEFFPWETMEEYLDTRLRSIGSDLEELREQGTITRRARNYWPDY